MSWLLLWLCVVAVVVVVVLVLVLVVVVVVVIVVVDVVVMVIVVIVMVTVLCCVVIVASRNIKLPACRRSLSNSSAFSLTSQMASQASAVAASSIVIAVDNKLPVFAKKKTVFLLLFVVEKPME